MLQYVCGIELVEQLSNVYSFKFILSRFWVVSLKKKITEVQQKDPENNYIITWWGEWAIKAPTTAAYEIATIINL